jgi:hypothetical protein
MPPSEATVVPAANRLAESKNTNENRTRVTFVLTVELGNYFQVTVDVEREVHDDERSGGQNWEAKQRGDRTTANVNELSSFTFAE